MRHIVLVALLGALLAGCGPASRLTWSERAYIHCRETLREPGTCVPDVSYAWERLAGACGIHDNVLRVCSAEFDRRYGCQVSTREVKKTDDKGNVTIIKEEFRSGPGCSMGPGEFSRLQFAFQSECVADRNPPDISSREGARCDCRYGGCSFDYPDVTDETAVRYFPEKADK